jgi:feruloyl esterase
MESMKLGKKMRFAALGATLLLGLDGHSQAATDLPLKAACESLSGWALPAQVTSLGSGPVRIASANRVNASPATVAERGPTPAARFNPAVPEFCRVLGAIDPVDPKAPQIQFQINLPMVWNGRSVQYGGGGFNGVLINALTMLPAAPFDQALPLSQGYVTYGTDSGHQNQAGQPPQVFALNDEALVNFAHASYKKVRDVAVEVMKRSYGQGPEKLYFFGSSEGGREGLTMAQRYPQDFDGIFSRVPVIHWTGLQHTGLRDGMALMNGGWLPPAQVQLVGKAVLAACDAADGLADGIVSDPVGCRQRFDVRQLQCENAAADTCLTAPQVRAVQTLNAPLRLDVELANGLTEYPGRGPSGEALPAFGPTGGWMAWWTGATAPSLPPVPSNGIGWFYGAGAIQYFYARNPSLDVGTYRMRDHAARVQEISALMDSTHPDLSAFHARGGKLIVLENMADYAQSPYAGIAYFESVSKTMGSDKTASFMRLYTAPSVDHVGSGGPANVDMLGALSDWVEHGKAPGTLELLEQSVSLPVQRLRARPLCQWPLVPRYQSGDVNNAASFKCSP